MLKEVVPPAIPHLGVFLSDLTFVSEGNPDILYDNLINFKKSTCFSLWQLTILGMYEYSIIDQVLQFQQDEYNLRPCPVIYQLLEQFKDMILSPDEIFAQSRKSTFFFPAWGVLLGVPQSFLPAGPPVDQFFYQFVILNSFFLCGDSPVPSWAQGLGRSWRPAFQKM